MAEVILLGKRVYLAASLRRVEAKTIYQYFQDRDIIRYLSSVPDSYVLKDAEDFLHYLGLIEGDKSVLELGMFDQETDQFLGMISLEDIDHEIGKCEMGYWLAKDYWGQGYALEAATLVLNYAFTELKLQKVCAYLIKENVKSLQLLKRLGFQVEGLLRRDLINKGELVDRYVCGLLAEEWRAS